MIQESVTTWYLQMLRPQDLRPAAVPMPEPLLMQARHPLPALSRFLYTAVGGSWFWRDRLGWSYPRWQQWLARDTLETWVLYVDGTPAGYIELEMQPHHAVEIAYFGLMPEFCGRGLGGHLLSRGIARAWAMGANRVWVHTCSWDGPAALVNYEARGLHRYHEETRLQSRPEQADGPWPGWDRHEPIPRGDQ